jgi:hypothetical protein
MSHDALATSMFWVGALFVFTPIVCVAGVLLAIRWQRRRDAAAAAAGEQPPP